MDGDLKDLFAQTTVTRVTKTRRGDRIRVYIDSPVLIEKQDLWKLEEELTRQLLPGRAAQVTVHEHFTLSRLYTPKTLLRMYEESFAAELRREDPVLHTIFQTSSIRYPDEEHVTVAIENNVVGRMSAPRLVRALERLITERCDLNAQIDIEYVEPEKKEEADDVYRVPVYKVPFYDDGVRGEQTEKDTGDTREAKKGASGKKTYLRGVQKERRVRNDDHPDVLYGRFFQEPPVPIDTLDTDAQTDVVIRGEVTAIEDKPVRNGKHMITFGVYDRTDTMNVRLFVTAETAESLVRDLKGSFVKVRGLPKTDPYDHEVVLSFPTGIMKAVKDDNTRSDQAAEKRTELHLHTKMSDMDGITDVADYVKRAFQWGWKGIAITDHGVVQSLTAAGHVWDDLYRKALDEAKEAGKEAPDRQDFFKIVGGMECYLVDDEKGIVTNSKNQTLSGTPYVVFDLETTGFSPVKNRIIEIGAVRVENGKITDRFSSFVNPQLPIPYRITQITGITDSMVIDAKKIEEVLPEFLSFAKGAVLVGHNVSFDISFINENCKRLGYEADFTTFDTLGLSRTFFPRQARHTLDAVAKTLKIVLDNHHRAVDDAEATAGIFLRFLKMLEEKDVRDLDAVNALGLLTKEAVKHLRPQHAVLLAKNTIGRVHLYTLVSESHLHYYRHALPAAPLIPTSLLRKYREGLLVGSADANGELWQSVAEGRSEADIAKLVRAFDYLEVQPEENYAYMVDDERFEQITCMEDLREINRRIVALGEQYNKIVVATGDAHFLDPEDAAYREILVNGKDIKGGKADAAKPKKIIRKADARAPLYLRTTEEMLKSFEYLGTKKASEIVVKNPAKILDMCDSVTFVRPDKCAPVIEDSDKTLRKICYDKAHAIYGDPLPEIVEKRLEKELGSIIGNGFAVMYIIAQKLVWKSLEDGYIVGSRGSVGSSFVAFAAGITEVNALPPHYVCPSCKYSDFTSEEVRAYAGTSGCDMPDCDCPKCGTKMIKDGFDIPFETFLGFHGEKEPDIDLNFSGEYQAKAHKYTEEIFGKGQTYRAGTVSGLQDKTAFGVIQKYFEQEHITRRRAEVNRLVGKLSGVRHGTGQHPGGIIVLPKGEDINSFTPVQHPADDENKPVTTHYDYHSIDHNLLKLDILGHDDPTMVRFLHDATGIDPTGVPLDDEKVMRLFQDTSSLGIAPEDIGGTKLGCLGLPEFGTDNAMQMVLDAKPASFTDLIRLSGLAHGTDVWHGNIRDLILGDVCTLETAICNRDDIMNYLIAKGVDSQMAFDTMERVRKGKGLSDEMKTAMLNAYVPDWYIEACIKIKYMFPKAHATAYVMNAWRLAWFKVHEPLAFYAAWFSIRAKQVSYLDMCRGAAHLKDVMADYEHRAKELSNVEQLSYGVMRVAQEMYARGYEFHTLDLARAKAEKFQVIDGKIMPSLVAFDNMGPVAACAIEEAVGEGPFLSRDDFRERTRCPQKVIDALYEHGMLGDLPSSNQMSLFDMMR